MSVALTSRRAALAPGAWVRNELWRRARAMPSLDLQFADRKSLRNQVTGADLVTFTRASSGTYVDSQGVIKTAVTNEPRFDHNPTTGESLGLLVEEQRTNLLLRSEEFDNASWALGAATVTANAIAAPSGSLAADQLIETTATANHEVSQSFTPSANTSYTLSCYLKAATASTCGLRFSAGLNGSGVICSVDLVAKTATVTNGTGTATIVTLADGWFRVSLTATASASPSNTFAYVFRSLGVAGSTSNSIYLWGAQVEAGAFPTSYIPTTTAAVTRSADVASITGTAFSSWYRQDEGTVFSQGLIPPGLANFPTLNNASDGTTNNQWSQYAYTNGLYANLKTGGVTQGDPGVTGSPTAYSSYKLSTGLSVNNLQTAWNGSLGTNDPSASMPTSLNQLRLGAAATGAAFINTTIARLTYWPARLPNNVLQEITR